MGNESLKRFFRENPRFAVAFSGGVDSSFLLAAAVKAGCAVKAYGVRTAFQFASELEDSKRLAEALQVPFELIDKDIFQEAAVCANGPDRCYWCKRFLFSEIQRRMRRDGFYLLADGTNSDDRPENRPGFAALDELGVVSPLRLAHMGKDEIRAASREKGLFTAEKPSRSCIAVFAPEGHLLTPQLIEQTRRSLEC